ncbi:MAG: hypothetical protein ACM3YE_06950 [Bacteroidota bacterium]
MSIEKLLITTEKKSALTEIQKILITEYGVVELVAFGPGVKSEAAEGTVPELLALTENPVSFQERQAIMDMVAGINQKYNTSFTLLVFDKATWEVWAGQTLYQEVKRDGLQIW